MPEIVSSNTPSDSGSQADRSPVLSETVVAHALQIMGANQYTPTQGQVDKMIALQEKSMDYTHKDIHTYLPKDILTLCTFVFIVLVVSGIFVFATFYAKEYVGEVISGILGLIAGGGVGFGYGITHKKKKPSE